MKRVISIFAAITLMCGTAAGAEDAAVRKGWRFTPLDSAWTAVGDRVEKDYTETIAAAKKRIIDLSNLEDREGYIANNPSEEVNCKTDGSVVEDLRNKGSFAYENVDFGDGVKTLALSLSASKTGATLSARIDSVKGQAIGTLIVCKTDDGVFEVQPMAIDNTVTGVHKLYITYDSGVEPVSVGFAKLVDMEPKGATMPFVTIEAEEAKVSPTAAVNTTKTHPSTGDNNNQQNTPEQKAVQSASGKSYVHLSAQTEYVEFTAPIDANRLLFRYTIPRDSSGTITMYINDVQQDDVELESTYCYDQQTLFYQRSFDEKIINADVKAGDKIRFQKNPSNRCAYYGIDLLEFEMAPEAGIMPDGYISVCDYGAVPNDDNDDTEAIRACVQAASDQGKHVWLPEGQFIQTDKIKVPDNVSLKGAGIWYTELYCPVTAPTKNPWGGYVGFKLNDNITISDMMISGNSTFRDDQGIAIMGNGDLSGNNVTIDNVWFRNLSTVTGWAGLSNSVIKNCRMRGIYADAIHFGDVPQINNIAINNHIRGCGDDGIAIVIRQDYCDSNGRIAQNLVARYNTISSTYWGRGMSIVGGSDIVYADNIVSSAYLAGLIITTETLGESRSTAINNVKIQHNDIYRCGHNGHNHASIHFWMHASPLSNLVIDANEISEGSTRGIAIDGASYGDEGGRTQFNYNNVHDNLDDNFRNFDPMKMQPTFDSNIGI
ncbi:MAG: hypothetical protein J6N52_10280 [Clostridia bacterium]|nr:hypothetical protein [Clostridia bacterium]